MAITYPAAYSSVQGDGGNVGLAITTDTTPDTGDYLVVCICVNANGDTITAPGGWTEATVSDNSIATSGGQIRAYYLKDPADSTTYTWTVVSSTRRSIVGVLVRGADGTTFVDVKESNQSAPGANHTPPSLTSTVDNVGVVDFAGLRQFSPDTANWTVPASGLSWTEQKDVQGADSNNNVRLACGTAVAGAAGALSTTVWTQADTNEDSIIIRLAVRPASSGTNAPAGNTTATVAANASTAGVSPGAGGAAATVAANAATAGVAPAGGNAGATIAASSSAAGVSPAGGNTAATVAANVATAGLGVNAGNATVTVTAYDATVSTPGTAPAGHAGVTVTAYDATVTATPTVATGGGWWDLLSIAREARALAEQERTRRPVACPNDGEPLTEGPGGVLHCRYDGWVWQG